MNVSASKETILKKIRQALSTPVPVPFPKSEGTENFFQPLSQEAEFEFAENLKKLDGRFSFCVDEPEFTEQLKQLFKIRKWKKLYCAEDHIKDILSENGLGYTFDSDLQNCEACLTSCEALVARTGSIIVSSAQQNGRTASAYAPVHVCLAYTNQLVYDIKDALNRIKEKYKGKIPSLISFISGPSRTADIEKTLVKGVHGPKEVFCFLIER